MMKKWVQQLTDEHNVMLDHLDRCLLPFVEIRDKKRPAPDDPNEVVEPFLSWTQREFLPHLQEEQAYSRDVLMSAPNGEILYNEMVSQHDKLRAMACQAREEIVLLAREQNIREAWWDTLEMSTLWALRRRLSQHIDYEHQEIFPKAIALSAL